MRFEYKYLILESLLPELRAMILPYVESDRHAGPGPLPTYTVRSIYLDTFSFSACAANRSALERREKVRIRGYGRYRSGDEVFLEVKRKRGAMVSKSRAPVLYQDLAGLLASGEVRRYVSSRPGAPNAIEDASAFLFYFVRSSLRPVVLVVYEREAYHSRFDSDLRITVDRQLRSRPYPTFDGLFDRREMTPSLDGYAVLEIKFTCGLPVWLRSTLERLALRHRAISKYVMCLKAHGLPGAYPQRSMLAHSHGLQWSQAMCAVPRSWFPADDLTVSTIDLSSQVPTSISGD